MPLDHRPKVALCLPRAKPALPFAERYSFEITELREFDAVFCEIPDPALKDLEEVDALLCSSKVRLDGALIRSMRHCRIIAVGSVGVDQVDMDAATEAGIVVTNVADASIEEVADHCMALLLSCLRRICSTDRLVREGGWKLGRSLYEEVPRIWGKTLGLLGFGRIARAVCRRAQAFGLRVITSDPYVDESVMTAAGADPVTLPQLLERADILSLHAALNSETRHILDASALAETKTGVTILNTARGGLIDETALTKALQSGQVAAAGLDVLETEPPDSDNPLLALEQVVFSPHCAAASDQLLAKSRRQAAREVALTLRGLWPRSCVNPEVLPQTNLKRWQPHSLDHGPNR